MPSRTSVLPVLLPRSGITIFRRKVTIPRARSATINIHVSGVTVVCNQHESKPGLAWLNNKHACDEVIYVINIDLAPAILPCCFTRWDSRVLRPPTVCAGGHWRGETLFEITRDHASTPRQNSSEKRSFTRAFFSQIVARITCYVEIAIVRRSLRLIDTFRRFHILYSWQIMS